jgi:hypothetical protein
MDQNHWKMDNISPTWIARKIMMQYVEVKLKPHFLGQNWNSTKGRLFSPKHWN